MSIDGLKWRRSVVEDALREAGYIPSSSQHFYVVEYMVKFQRHTDCAHECARWAIARATNLAEQRTRRIAHGTGATAHG